MYFCLCLLEGRFEGRWRNMFSGGWRDLWETNGREGDWRRARSNASWSTWSTEIGGDSAGSRDLDGINGQELRFLSHWSALSLILALPQLSGNGGQKMKRNAVQMAKYVYLRPPPHGHAIIWTKIWLFARPTYDHAYHFHFSLTGSPRFSNFKIKKYDLVADIQMRSVAEVEHQSINPIRFLWKFPIWSPLWVSVRD